MSVKQLTGGRIHKAREADHSLNVCGQEKLYISRSQHMICTISALWIGLSHGMFLLAAQARAYVILALILSFIIYCQLEYLHKNIFNAIAIN